MILDHICLKTANFSKSLAFYQKMYNTEIVHEWGVDNDPDHAAMLLIEGELMLEIFDWQEELPDDGKWNHLAFRTEDIHATVAKAVTFGAEVVVEPAFSDIPKRDGSFYNIWFAYIKSPGGEIIEFIQPEK